MYYVEMLAARNRLLWFSSIVVLIGLVAIVTVRQAHAVNVDVEGSVGVPFGVMLLGASWFTCIMSTLLGATLARDYLHLPYIWTRPIARGRIAFEYILVDCVTILIAFGILVGVAAAVLSVVPRLYLESGQQTLWPALLRAISVPLMWYGLIEVASSWRGKRAQSFAGLSWAVFWALIILDALNFPGPAGAVIVALNLFNPMAYLPQQHSSNFTVGVTGAPAFPLSFNEQTLLAYFIFFASCIVAIYAWKRMEV